MNFAMPGLHTCLAMQRKLHALNAVKDGQLPWAMSAGMCQSSAHERISPRNGSSSALSMQSEAPTSDATFKGLKALLSIKSLHAGVK